MYAYYLSPKNCISISHIACNFSVKYFDSCLCLILVEYPLLCWCYIHVLTWHKSTFFAFKSNLLFTSYVKERVNEFLGLWKSSIYPLVLFCWLRIKLCNKAERLLCVHAISLNILYCPLALKSAWKFLVLSFGHTSALNFTFKGKQAAV